MALHKNFPKNPYQILNPDIRWFPADETLREKGFDKLIPPLVGKLRKNVSEWRDNNYNGASDVAMSLIKYWFLEEHIITNNDGSQYNFQYYFSQREAVETIIYLLEIAKVEEKEHLLEFDNERVLSKQRFEELFTEEWLRFVIKLATGGGKTKVMSLLIAYFYFHKLYIEDSKLAKSFLLIAPNIIVFDRLKNDFEDLKIFYNDPVLPENGYDGYDWQNDFQITIHFQDDIKNISETGNIFLTNIHRVFENDVNIPSIDDEDTTEFFIGDKPVSKTNDSKVDLGKIVREIDELIIINDEAHHIHEENAWMKSIRDIDRILKSKNSRLKLQIDLTATPKKKDGSIFPQVISDYPLVEAIHQGVVKRPVLPDEASRAKLTERESVIFSERYRDHINLGVEEWRKTYKELVHTGKKSLLFVMTIDTLSADEVANYLERTYPEFKNAVLVIHTNKSGEILEGNSGKSKEELDVLRKAANELDSNASPYKVVVSVMVLKEGWDVKNVTTIIGLRPYASDSKILPEQTLGRGLRRMYFGNNNIDEYVSVVGSPAFMDFVESIKSEGVELEKRAMGGGSNTNPISPIVIEIDKENKDKDLEKLDISVPRMTARIEREYKNLSELDLNKFEFKKSKVKEFSKEEQKEIVFKDVVEDTEHHITILDTNIEMNYNSVVGYFATNIMRDLRLFGCYDILFPKIKSFIEDYMFENNVNINDINILRNLSEIENNYLIKDTFKKEINNLTVRDKGDTEIKNYMKISSAKPFIVNDTNIFIPNKSVYNKMFGDSGFELDFAMFLDKCPDVISFSKNYANKESNPLVIEYQNKNGDLSKYYPDFFVKSKDDEVYIIETKGREDENDKLKYQRLVKWCEDVNKNQKEIKYISLYVEQEKYEEYKPKSFDELVRLHNK